MLPIPLLLLLLTGCAVAVGVGGWPSGVLILEPRLVDASCATVRGEDVAWAVWAGPADARRRWPLLLIVL